MEEQNTQTKDRKRLSPEATILLTFAGSALAVVVYRILYFIVTGS